MFFLFLIGIIVGVYIKETIEIPKMKPFLNKLFEGNRNEEKPGETEDKKENTD
jgi:hypothetical protein